MKKIAAIVIALMLAAFPAYADAARPFVVDTDSGAMLIDENGVLLTGIGEYDVIDRISPQDCPNDRVMFMVSQMDLSGDFYADDDFEEFGGWTTDFEDSDWKDSWDEELDEVEEWPVDLEQLDEGYDMGIVEDVPLDAEGEYDEFGDVLSDDDSWMLNDDYMGYDSYYGVALMNAKGELVTGFDYVGFWHDVDNGMVQAYSPDGFMSILDEQGNVLINGMFTSVVSDTQGGYFAIMPEFDDETGDFREIAPIVRVSAAGDIVPTGINTFSYESLPGFSEGLMCVLVCGDDADYTQYSYAYIDVNGNDALGRSFEYAVNFTDGYAEVTDSDYVAHLIDKSGEYVTNGEYSYFDCGSAGDGMPIVGNLMDGGFDLISKEDFSIIASFRSDDPDSAPSAYNSGDRLIMAYVENETVILDGSGAEVYRCPIETNVYTWYEITDSQPQRLLLEEYDGINTSYRVADFAGNPVSEAYRDIAALSWTDGEGRFMICEYELIEVVEEDFSFMEPDFDTIRYGVIDQDGNVLIPMEYDYFSQLAADRYWVGSDTDYKLMDKNGGVIVEITAE